MHASKGRKRFFSRKSESVGGAMLSWAGFLFSGEGGGGTRAQRRGATRETKRATQNKQNNNSMATGGFCLVRSPLGGRPYQKKSTATGDTLWANRIVLLSFYKLRLDKHTKHSTLPKPKVHPFFLICP